MALLLAQLAIDLGGGRRLVWAVDHLAAVWLVAGVAAIALIAMLYRYERRLVTPGMGRLLMALRLLAALALVAALFEPIAERRYTETVRGKLVLGVDLSDSMATVDAGRTGTEREGLARSLGLESAETLEPLSRREVVRRLLAGALGKDLERVADIDAVGFAGQAVEMEGLDRLTERLARAEPDGDSSGERTDWRPVLEHAVAHSSEQPLLGVVLLSDGRQNVAVGTEGDALGDRLAERGIPVSSIVIGSTQPPRDAAIASIRLPERLAKGDAADVDVTLKIDGEVPGSDVPVILERAGAEPIRKLARVPGDGTRPSVSFRVPLDRAGLQTVTVRVGPFAEDARPDNDARAATIEVTDDTTRVLLVEGQPRWEFRYLRNALARDPHVSVDSVVFRQPTALESSAATYPARLPDASVGAPDPINGYEVIFVGDVTEDEAQGALWTRLESFVDRRGGTLVLSAGARSFEAWLRDATARKLLPVLDARALEYDPEAVDPGHPSMPPGVRLQPVAEAEAEEWPMVRFASEPERNRMLWQAMPRMPWVLASRLKPSATPLVRAEGVSGSGEPADVVAAMPYGLGRVLWVGTDSTWRWRHRAGDTFHHRFWGQVVRWASASKLTAGNSLVKFGPVRPRVPEGQGIAIRARFAEEGVDVASDQLVAARVFRARPRASAGADSPGALEPEGDAVAVVPLRASSIEPRLFEGIAPALAPGLYAVTLDVPEKPGMPTDAAALEIAGETSPERVELAASREAVEHLAGTTGGKVYSEGEALQLPKAIESRTQPRTRVEATPLWDRPISLIVFFALLAAEWALRKRAGLP